MQKSDSGDCLSPKKAPQQTAPAVIATGMPKPMEMPMKAIPMVEAVVQEEPVIVDMIAHMMATKGRKIAGLISSRPR